ncbi:MAG: ATP-binding protein [Aquificota bacterium]|nr:MAG: ATP-binding protein [Aquificota bacterium]
MNREDLQDVLYNLIGNAIKHSRGFVHIKTCSRRDLLVVRNDMSPVENHGMGLGVELTRRILEKYGFRLKISLRKHYTAFIQFKKRE